MSRILRILLIVLLLTVSLLSHTQTAQSQGEVVRALLFYSPTCGHCHYVITEILPPLFDKYGEQLQVIGVDISQSDGYTLFISALQYFGLDQGGVPLLAIGDVYLMGSVDIPEKFPALIDQYMAQGGVDWPKIPGLVVTQDETIVTPEPTPTLLPVVNAILFTRSTCSHCQDVFDEVIPPLVEKYGNQLHIFSVDVSLSEGDALYSEAIQKFQIQNIGVPTLVIGDHVLVGKYEIQQEFPQMIEDFLGNGGIDWPDLSGLPELIASNPPTSTPPPYDTNSVNGTGTPDSSAGSSFSHSLSFSGERAGLLALNFVSDPVGYSLAVIVLLGMVASVIWSFIYLRKPDNARHNARGWTIPVLCIVGFGVAAYLAYVEVTQSTAICGPVGDCNTVQQSDYARLFGILPIGVLGMAGYVMIFLAWLMMRISKGNILYVSMALLAMTLFGTIFSIYLTLLEILVIHAICAWCLSSAVIMTLLMLISLGPVKRILFHSRNKKVRRIR